MRYYLELAPFAIMVTIIVALLPAILMVVSRVKSAPSKKVLLQSGFFLFVTVLLMLAVVRLFTTIFQLTI